eukprot:g45542.t1
MPVQQMPVGYGQPVQSEQYYAPQQQAAVTVHAPSSSDALNRSLPGHYHDDIDLPILDRYDRHRFDDPEIVNDCVVQPTLLALTDPLYSQEGSSIVCPHFTGSSLPNETGASPGVELIGFQTASRLDPSPGPDDHQFHNTERPYAGIPDPRKLPHH